MTNNQYLVIASIVLISNILSFLEIHLPSTVQILLQYLIPKYPVVWECSPYILYYPYFYSASKYNLKMDEGLQILLWGMHGMDFLVNKLVTYHKNKKLEVFFWRQAFCELSPDPHKKHQSVTEGQCDPTRYRWMWKGKVMK